MPDPQYDADGAGDKSQRAELQGKLLVDGPAKRNGRDRNRELQRIDVGVRAVRNVDAEPARLFGCLLIGRLLAFVGRGVGRACFGIRRMPARLARRRLAAVSARVG